MTAACRKLTVFLAGLMLLGGCVGPPAPVSPAPVSPAPVTSPGGVDPVALQQQVEDYIRTGAAPLDKVRAVLVAVDGQTRLEYYRHGFTAGDHEHVWSVTKSVISTLVGIAIGEGLITGVDTPLKDLLPEYRKVMTPRAANVTLHQLMNHTSGFIGGDGTYDLQWDVLTGKGDPVVWALSKDEAQKLPHGFFVYSDVGAHLVAAVLHSALQRHPATKGQSILDYARTKLFDPLGITSKPAVQVTGFSDTDPEFAGTGFGWARAHGVELGGFGLRLTAPDMAKLGQLYLDHGMWNGNRLLPDGWVAQATAASPLANYGLLWWRDIDGRFEAHGYEGQRIVVIPDHRAVIVTVSATADTDYPLDEIGDLIDTAVLPALD